MTTDQGPWIVPDAVHATGADAPDASLPAVAVPAASESPNGTPTATVPGGDGFDRDTEVRGPRQFVTDYLRRVRGGEVGALPALLGLAILVVIFSQANDQFLTTGNLANLVSQSGITTFIAMGLVFVLLLGEIDLAAGTASGVCAATMGEALLHNGDLHAALGTPTYLTVLAFMVLAIGIAVWSRLWPGAVIVLAGLVMIVLQLGTATQLGAMFVAISAGVAIGLFTGALVARVGIPSFVVTLALFLAWQGVLLQFMGNGGAIPLGQQSIVIGISNKYLDPMLGWLLFVVLVGGYAAITVLRARRRRAGGLAAEPMLIVVARAGGLVVLGAAALWFLNQERSPNPTLTSIKGMPYVLPLILVTMIGCTLVLNRTSFGRHLYAVGGNAEAARRAGIDLTRMRIAAFTIGSGLAALGGIAGASKLGDVPADAGGSNTLLFAVAAAVIGGTSLFGGRGRARDAVLGGLVISIIPNGLGLIGMPDSMKYIVTGGVLLIAASVDALTRKRAATGR